MKLARFAFMLMLVPLVALVGCQGDEGPAGPPGPPGSDGTDGIDGQDGVDGNVTCLACHNTQTQRDIALQYSRSQHALGEYVDYAGGRSSCARCHSGGGFVEWVATGDVDGNINVPVAIGCSHCHNVHTTFEETDYALRSTAPVGLLADAAYFVDFDDSSNLCANCHQSRRAEPAITNPGETFEITSTHYGPHHGAQANVLEGVGFAEIQGSTAYPTSSLHLSAGATCVTCHMGDFTDGAGGHTWTPTVDTCNDCHSTNDFNYGDIQEDTQEMLDQLRDLLLAAGVIEYVEADEAYEPIVGTYPMEHARAFFNWIGIAEDRSLGVHNPKYVEALLENSIEAMTP